MKPDALPVEDEANNVCQCAWAETSALGEMNIVANLAAQPFFLVDVDRNCGITTFCNPAAATGIAVRQVRTVLHDVEGASIRSNDTLAMRSRHDQTSSNGLRCRTTHTRYGPPISASMAP